MSQQLVNIGAAPEDGTGDQLRVAFDKCNDNFTELYTAGAATSVEGIWNFNQTSTDTTTSPSSGRFRTNSGNAATATQLAIHRLSINGFDRADTLRTQHVGDIIKLQDKTNADSWARFTVQATPVDNTDWFQINVAFDSGGGTPPGNNQEILFTFVASSGGGGGGNVSNVGTPTNGQLAQWTDATHIQGVDTSTITAGLAPLASPTFTGDPKAPTPSPGDNDTSIATTAFVTAADNAVKSQLIGSASSGMDTLGEIENYIAANITPTLGNKADIFSPTFTGDPKAPTPTAGDNDTSIATTAFVAAAVAAAGGGGNVSNTGTPTSGQFAQWASATVIQGISGTIATAALDLFTSTLKGLAPASGGGTANFLRADGSWVAPSGGVTSMKIVRIVSTGTYTPTAGMKFALVELTGGGGGGGGATCAAGSACGACGGGGGAYVRKMVTAAQVGASQSVTIGTGGGGGNNTGTNGASGGTTSFGALASAPGGSGGGGVTGPGSGVSGGSGGDWTFGSGDFGVHGEGGGAGLMLSITTSAVFAGRGGNTFLSRQINGQQNLAFASAGLAGGNFTGNGGNGAVAWNGTGAAGGTGGSGTCVVTEYI